jgi:hypothetical protein
MRRSIDWTHAFPAGRPPKRGKSFCDTAGWMPAERAIGMLARARRHRSERPEKHSSRDRARAGPGIDLEEKLTVTIISVR